MCRDFSVTQLINMKKKTQTLIERVTRRCGGSPLSRPAGGTVALKNRAHVPVGEVGREDGAAPASSNASNDSFLFSFPAFSSWMYRRRRRWPPRKRRKHQATFPFKDLVLIGLFRRAREDGNKSVAWRRGLRRAASREERLFNALFFKNNL